MSASVIAVASKSTHSLSKNVRDKIMLIGGFGVEGDAHMSVTVKHRSRVANDPSMPNLRQVYLIDFEEFAAKDFSVALVLRPV